MKKSMAFWQMIGFIVTSIGGTLLHFLYDWTGNAWFVGIFSAINESIWEHMKLLFFPMFLFAIWEYFRKGRQYPNFWCIKALGITLGLVMIPLLYYTYTGALGVHWDWLNIAIFFLVAALVFWLETRWFHSHNCRHPKLAFLWLCFLAAAFALFTFYPPKLPIFAAP